MISRIRIEAHGPSASDVDTTLHHVAWMMDEELQLEAAFGEHVIERVLDEPHGNFAYKGRLSLHPNTAFRSAFKVAAGIAEPEPGNVSGLIGTGTLTTNAD